MSNEPLDPSPSSLDREERVGPRRVRVRRQLMTFLAALLTAAMVATFWGPLEVRWRQSQARSLLHQRRNAEALAELRLALRHDLDNPATILLVARTHRRLDNAAKVSLLLDRAEALGGDRGWIERERRLALAQSGRVREVEPYLADMLISAGEDGPDICEAFVQGYFANLRSGEALQLLDVWQKSYPDDPQPIFMRAYLWQGMDHPAQAIELYREGLAMAPQQTVMRRRLGEALLKAGRIEDAESELLLCVQQVPDDAEVRYLLAQCAYARSDLDQATQRLGETLNVAPDHLDARRLKGQLDLARGKLDESLRELEAVIEQRPYDILAHEALGRSLRALGRTDDAKTHFDFVAQAEKSISRMNRLLRESISKPKDAELRYEIGTILFQYGPPDDAAQWMRAALELDPNHAGARRALTAFFKRRGDAASVSLPDGQEP